MFKKKIAVIAVVGMLAMCVGLTACGGSSASSSSAASSSAASSAAASSSAASSSAASSAAASSSAASAEAESTVLYWEGTLADGSSVTYLDDATSNEVMLFIVKQDLSDAMSWMGTESVAENGTVTITDDKTKGTISYTVTDITPTSTKINLGDYGEVELKPVTSAELEAELATLAAAGEQALKDLAAEGEKALKELEAGAQQLAKEVSEKAEKFANEVAALDDSTVFFWEGTLADGGSVIYMDDPETTEAFLAIIKADASDGVAWYGKYVVGQDGKTYTLIDSKGETAVNYTIVESVPNTSMKMNIEWFGTVDLKPVTKGDFVKLAEELEKLGSEATAK